MTQKIVFHVEDGMNRRDINSNVAEMADKLLPKKFDIIIYTSAIEHMNKDDGQQSLYECRKVATPDTILILTCPNTPEDKDGYDTQYRAHVYKWKRSKLLKVITEYGLLHDKKVLKHKLEKVGGGHLLERVSKFVPHEWYIPVFSPMFPKSTKEIGFVCKAI